MVFKNLFKSVITTSKVEINVEGNDWKDDSTEKA